MCLVLLLSYLTNTITTNFNIKKTRKKLHFEPLSGLTAKRKRKQRSACS